MKKLILLTVVIFLTACSTISRLGKYEKLNKNNESKSIDDYANIYMNSDEAVGLIIGVVKDGKTQVYSYGTVKKGVELKPNEKTIFEIGSISKTFTTSVLAEMHLNKEIDMNTEINDYILPESEFPKFRNKDTKATLLHLATHTSGLSRIPKNIWQKVDDEDNPYKDYYADDLFDEFRNKKLKYKTEKKQLYSNSGMGLLGYVLAKENNQTYEEMIKTRITLPLGMNDTVINLSEEQIRRTATPYEKAEEVKYWDMNEIFQGAGNIKSTMADMLIYLKANLGYGNKDLVKVFQETHKQVLKIKEEEYLLGWHKIELKDKSEFIVHDGGTGGFSSFIAFNKEKEFGVVILSNSTQYVGFLALNILENFGE